MILEALTRIFDEEVDKRVNEKLTKYVEYVSKNYDISMKLLLRDLQNIDELSTNTPKAKETGTPGQCLGINKSSGRRCKFKSKHSHGYCNKHLDQVPKKPVTVRKKAVTTGEILIHNHTIPPIFSKDCPACVKTNESKENLLIDI